MQDKLLILEGVQIHDDIRIPDVSLSSGEVVLVQTQNDLEADVFISFLFGLFPLKTGKAWFSGASLAEYKHGLISYVDLSRWHPKIDNLEHFIKTMAYAKGLQVSYVLNDFKRILEGAGASYALDLSFDEMKPATKKVVSTCITLSMPQLLMVLLDPFFGLDKDNSLFISEQIKKIATDGSAFIILADTVKTI
ncbi:MAG: hypothetical protein WCQ47_01705 [bacterium]